MWVSKSNVKSKAKGKGEMAFSGWKLRWGEERLESTAAVVTARSNAGDQYVVQEVQASQEHRRGIPLARLRASAARRCWIGPRKQREPKLDWVDGGLGAAKFTGYCVDLLKSPFVLEHALEHDATVSAEISEEKEFKMDVEESRDPDKPLKLVYRCVRTTKVREKATVSAATIGSVKKGARITALSRGMDSTGSMWIQQKSGGWLQVRDKRHRFFKPEFFEVGQCVDVLETKIRGFQELALGGGSTGALARLPTPRRAPAAAHLSPHPTLPLTLSACHRQYCGHCGT